MSSPAAPEPTQVTTEPKKPNPSSPTLTTLAKDESTNQKDNAVVITYQRQKLDKANAELAEAKAQLANLNSAKAQEITEVPTTKEQVTEFYADPISATRNIVANEVSKIQKKLEDVVAPLNEVATMVKADRTYPALKMELATNPKYAAQMQNPHFVQVLDTAVSNGMIDINGANGLAALEQMTTILIGSAVTGQVQIPGLTPGLNAEPINDSTSTTIPTKEQRRDLIEPPYVPQSSAPPTGELAGENKMTEEEAMASLSENQRRLIRENKMTALDYLAMSAIQPDEVATSTIGIKEKTNA